MNSSFIFFALLGGAGLALQTAVNSRLSDGVGQQPVAATLVSFFIGTLCLSIASLVAVDWQQVWSQIGSQPLWRFSGGVLGAMFVFVSIFLAPKLGVTNTIFLFIIGQLCAGMLIDHFGLIQMPIRPVHWWKLVGMIIMLLGLGLFMFGHRWFNH